MMKILLSLLLFMKLNADPGLLILKTKDPICSLNKQARWLEKYLTIPYKSYTGQTELPSKIKHKTIFLNFLFLIFGYVPHMISRDADTIFCCQSMFETTSVPESWVDQLNRYLDFVTVPDEYLVNVYKNAGVQIPIYLLPMGSFLEDWLRFSSPIKERGRLSFWLREIYIKRGKTTIF